MIVILITVPRSGGGFFEKVLSQHFLPVGMGSTIEQEDGFVSTHVSSDGLRVLNQVLDKHPPGAKPLILTTWRDWEKVKASFQKRGDPVGSPEKPVPGSFYWHFAAWEELVRKFRPMIVTIEPEYKRMTRSHCLAALGKKLGVKFKTDWVPVNQSSP